MTKNKRPINLQLLAATALIIGAGSFLYFHSTIKPILSHNITDVSNGQIPSGMPADIFMPKDAQVVHSYTATDSKTGMTEATIIYTTSQKQMNILQAYTQYLVENGWTMKPPITRSSSSSSIPLMLDRIEATKGQMDFSVKASQSLSKDPMLVSLDLLTSKK